MLEHTSYIAIMLWGILAAAVLGTAALYLELKHRLDHEDIDRSKPRRYQKVSAQATLVNLVSYVLQ